MVEELRDVCGDVVVGGEEADVLVLARSRRVVVARADVRVAAEDAALAPNDEGRLGMDLHVREAVGDMDSCLLERVRPLDVPALVEPRFELDEADRLLALLGAANERADQCAVVRRAVDGRLHHDDVRILCGRLGEGLEARTIRVVGLVDEDVPAANLVEQRSGPALRACEARGHDRQVRFVLQVRAVELRELHELGEIERALDPVDLRVVDRQAGREPFHHLLRRRRAHLDTDDVAEAALAKLGLDRFEEIRRVVGHLEVGVPGHAEDRPLDDGHTREEPRQEVRDDLLERYVQALATDGEETRQALRDLDAGESLLAALRVLDEDGERQGEAGDVRKRLSRTDCERREHGVDLTLEALVELLQIPLVAVLDPADRRSPLPQAQAGARASRCATGERRGRALVRGSAQGLHSA